MDAHCRALATAAGLGVLWPASAQASPGNALFEGLAMAYVGLCGVLVSTLAAVVYPWIVLVARSRSPSRSEVFRASSAALWSLAGLLGPACGTALALGVVGALDVNTDAALWLLVLAPVAVAVCLAIGLHRRLAAAHALLDVAEG